MQQDFYCSQLYGSSGDDYWNNGTYFGIRRIIIATKDDSLTSLQLHYALQGDESVKAKDIKGFPRGSAQGDRKEESHSMHN